MSGPRQLGGTPHEVRRDGYYGYLPKSPEDYPYEEDAELNRKLDEDVVGKVRASLLTDFARTSRVLMICMLFFVFAFIVFLAWAILIGECKAKRFCDILDRSSFGKAGGSFKPLTFVLPTKLVWIGMLVSVLGLLFASGSTFTLAKLNVGTSSFACLGSMIRQYSQRILRLQLLVCGVFALIVFLMLGIGMGWRLAGGYGNGSLYMATSTMAVLFTTMLTITRVKAAADGDLRTSVNVLFRSSAVISTVVLSLALAGTSLAYVLYEDVRVLVGFAVGASLLGFVLRVVGGIFFKSASASQKIIQRVQRGLSDYSMKNYATTAAGVGVLTGRLASIATDYFETGVCSILAMAFLGAGLPYFHRDQYALCVYNHLSIDKRCGPFGYMNKKFSYAQYICKSDQLYLSYPRLSVWQSNSVFVALPFVIAVGGVLSIVFLSLVLQRKSAFTDSESTSGQVIQLRRFWHKCTIIAGFLAVCVCATICFSLFGGNSTFQSAEGLGKEKTLEVYKLADGNDACLNEYMKPENSSSPVVLPRGKFERAQYSPTLASEMNFGTASQVPWRLFGCCLIGIAFQYLSNASSAYFVSERRSPSANVTSSGSHGFEATAIDAISSSLIATLPPVLLVALTLCGALYIFGSYGLALAVVSVWTVLGFRLSSEVVGVVSDTCKRLALCTIPITTPSSLQSLMAMKRFGSKEMDISRASSHGASCLTAFALLVATIDTSGLLPLPTELIGTPRVVGSRFLGEDDVSSFSDVYVTASLSLGFSLPFLITGLLLISTSRLSRWMTLHIRKDFLHIPDNRMEDALENDNLKTSLSTLGNLSVVEGVLPCAIAIFAPIIVGFSFGKRALLAWVVGAVTSSFLLATFCTVLAGTFNTSLMVLESGILGEDSSSGSKQHQAVTLGSSVGETLRDTAGSMLNGLAKSVSVLCLLLIYLMQNGLEKGWIGAILFIVLAAFVMIVTVWGRLRDKARQEALVIDMHDEPDDFDERAPMKVVSPFYVDRTLWSPENVVPGSQMHDAMLASGVENEVFDPTSLPGLRSDHDFEVQVE